jgi:PmbA protein
MRNILMTAWMEFSGEAMSGGSSIFCNELGARVGSEVLTFINAPSHPLIGQSWHVDSEGTLVPETTVVENGRFVSPLYTLSSGAAVGKLSTGSAGRVARMTGDVPIALTTVPAVFYVVPAKGDATLLAERMGTGLLLTYSLDLFHSINVASGEFSIPCGGVYYENGKPTGVVSQMTMAGNLRELWCGIEAVGEDLDFDDFYFQTYCVGSPSVLVRGLTFAS